MIQGETDRKRAARLWDGMETEQTVYMPTWLEVADYVVPWRGRYLRRSQQRGSTPNDGRVLGADIVNSIASRALNTLASGMMSSLTSPARPWFRLTTADPTLAELGAVRGYLFQVERLVQWVFARSNIHNELHVAYRDLASFGTAPLHIDEDDDDVIRAYVLPPGQYRLACNSRQRVDSMGREFQFTVRQLRQRFGELALCRASRKLLAKGELNQWRRVLHLVLPNEDFEPGSLGPKGMRWRSEWWERDADADEGPLRIGGYRQFPTAASRWQLTGTEDVYGHSPVRELLPDIKQLQHMDTQKITLHDKAVTPPMQGPAGGDPPSLLAGAWSELPAALASGGLKSEPLLQVTNGQMQEARVSVAELEMRIRVGLHEDLWRLLVDRDQASNGLPRPGAMTATEVATRHEEALTLLGPVVDRTHNELLSPLIRRTVSVLSEKGLLPPPPRELIEALTQGEDVRIEYMSVLAQAQRLLGLGAVERFVSIVTALSGGDPNHPVWDKVDRDEIVDQSADMLGVPPSTVVPDDQVAEARISRARQQQQAMQMQAAQVAARTTRDLSAPAAPDSALSRLLAQYGPQAVGTQANVPGGVA